MKKFTIPFICNSSTESHHFDYKFIHFRKNLQIFNTCKIVIVDMYVIGEIQRLKRFWRDLVISLFKFLCVHVHSFSFYVQYARIYTYVMCAPEHRYISIIVTSGNLALQNLEKKIVIHRSQFLRWSSQILVNVLWMHALFSVYNIEVWFSFLPHTLLLKFSVLIAFFCGCWSSSSDIGFVKFSKYGAIMPRDFLSAFHFGIKSF